MARKAEMLNVDNFDDEYQIKSGCNRRKSVDFNRERVKTINNKLMPIAKHRVGGSNHNRKRATVNKTRAQHLPQK